MERFGRKEWERVGEKGGGDWSGLKTVQRKRVEKRQEFKSSREPKKKHANVQRSEETVGKEVEPRVYRVAVIFQFIFTVRWTRAVSDTGNRDAGKLNVGWPSTSDAYISDQTQRRHVCDHYRERTSVNSEMHAQRIEGAVLGQSTVLPYTLLTALTPFVVFDIQSLTHNFNSLSRLIRFQNFFFFGNSGIISDL